ncbi:MAG: hypothetical protein KDD62_07915, partial [Bdellovibrionales bacterium]|nr:hypothetical protein [Bdellovibrionales bacterium]
IAYISAHHLQEPIKKALLTTDLLEEEVRDKVDLSSNENWQRVKRALHRASVLKLDLHAYLKLFTAEPLHERVELNQVIETVCRSLAQSIEAVNGTVEVEKLPCLLGDPQEFTDLFLHLIDNALKYRHPDRNPQVLIEGAAPLDGRVTLRVTDNGIGMPESRIETALELFGRLHNDTESEGTGLGLALVRRTVEMFGGVLSIESKEGLGTVVFFDLPVAPPSDLLVGNG